MTKKYRGYTIESLDLRYPQLPELRATVWYIYAPNTEPDDDNAVEIADSFESAKAFVDQEVNQKVNH